MPAIFTFVLVTTSCQTKQGPNGIRELVLNQCDELNIIYYSSGCFVFKTIDSITIKDFADLITYEQETFTDACETTAKLIFKIKGREIFTAQISTSNKGGPISCNYITYLFESKIYRHRLTYRTGMGISEIYWHYIDPKGNPWKVADSTKFYFEGMKGKL
jgi:hypothetical protein